MALGSKTCPICGAQNHPKAAVCNTCGTSLVSVEDSPRDTSKRRNAQSEYDRRYGETDLIEAEASRSSSIALTGLLILLPIVLCVGIVFGIGLQTLSLAQPTATPLPTVTQDIGGASGVTPTAEIILATNTLMPSPRLATITPAPPTPTMTFTPGPCERRVEAGQTLIMLAYSCGHTTSQDVLAQILEMNNLSAPEALIAGQLIYIPWPTPTPDPNAAAQSDNVEVADVSMSADGGSVESALAEQLFEQNLPTPTETLIPGVMWHTVQPNQSMVTIAYTYSTTAEVLAQLNPEITFSQCDYSLDTGGETCTVFLIAGQQMRVPAPTPTPTLSPTPSGSETPTPTFTPTFNAPSLLSPSNRALFLRNELVTLRWVPTGPLAADEQYMVTIRDQTIGAMYTDYTTQLYYIVPQGVQGSDSRRHEYDWTISVVRNREPSSARFTTESRAFTWEGSALPTPTGASN